MAEEHRGPRKRDASVANLYGEDEGSEDRGCSREESQQPPNPSPSVLGRESGPQPAEASLSPPPPASGVAASFSSAADVSTQAEHLRATSRPSWVRVAATLYEDSGSSPIAVPTPFSRRRVEAFFIAEICEQAIDVIEGESSDEEKHQVRLVLRDPRDCSPRGDDVRAWHADRMSLRRWNRVMIKVDKTPGGVPEYCFFHCVDLWPHYWRVETWCASHVRLQPYTDHTCTMLRNDSFSEENLETLVKELVVAPNSQPERHVGRSVSTG